MTIAEDAHKESEVVIREAVEIEEVVMWEGEKHRQLEGSPEMMIEPNVTPPVQV